MTVKVKTAGTQLKDTYAWLGIDQSYSGFAMTFINKEGQYETTVAKFDSFGITRLIEIRDHIYTTLVHARSRGVKVRAIAMEGYAYGSQMANMLGELGATVKIGLWDSSAYLEPDAKFPYIVAPTSLKKYATGKGNVQKNQILLQIYKKWGVEFKDDNAADSYALAHLISGSYSTAYEKEVYDSTKKPENREADPFHGHERVPAQ
jgi:crossover junction endodeoxyribonuclease RuvC